MRRKRYRFVVDLDSEAPRRRVPLRCIAVGEELERVHGLVSSECEYQFRAPMQHKVEIDPAGCDVAVRCISCFVVSSHVARGARSLRNGQQLTRAAEELNLTQRSGVHAVTVVRVANGCDGERVHGHRWRRRRRPNKPEGAVSRLAGVGRVRTHDLVHQRPRACLTLGLRHANINRPRARVSFWSISRRVQNV